MKRRKENLNNLSKTISNPYGITFIYQYDENSPRISINLPCPTLSEAIEQFESFLRAAGYSFDGMLDIHEKE